MKVGTSLRGVLDLSCESNWNSGRLGETSLPLKTQSRRRVAAPAAVCFSFRSRWLDRGRKFLWRLRHVVNFHERRAGAAVDAFPLDGVVARIEEREGRGVAATDI